MIEKREKEKIEAKIDAGKNRDAAINSNIILNTNINSNENTSALGNKNKTK